MLKVNVSNKSPVVEVRAITSDHFFTVNTAAGEKLTGIAVVGVADVIGAAWNGQAFCFPPKLIPIAHAAGFKSYREDGERVFTISNRPNTRHNSNGYDDQAYGNTFQKAYHALAGSNAIPGFSFPSNLHENYTRHWNASGSLITKSSVVPQVELPCYLWGPDYIRLCYNNPYTRVHVESVSPLILSPKATGGFVCDLIKLFDRFIEQGPSLKACMGYQPGTLDRNVIWEVATSNVNYYVDSNGSFHVSYHVWVNSPDDGRSWEFDASHTFSVQYPTPTISGTPTLGANYTLPGTTGTVTFSYHNFKCLSGLDRLGPSQLSRTASFTVSGFLLSTVPSSFSIDDYGDDWYISKPYSKILRIAEKFNTRVSESWPDILPSSTFSAVSALSKLEGSLDNNILQTLYKLPDFEKAIPDLRKAFSILESLVRKDLSFSTLRDVLDLATSTHLQASFTWRPYRDLLVKYIPAMAPILQTMLTDKHLTIGYGSFTHEFNQEFGREIATLVTRTKVVADLTLSGFWSAALSLDSVGLLPTFSRVWDLIPFTFAVNWIAGISRMLRNIEVIGTSSIIPILYIHTYTITSPFTMDELEALGASSTGNQPAGLRVYNRDYTYYTPVPRNSRFSFGTPSDFEHFAILGSLLYQLAKS
jgi:hypothetical protein